MTAHSPHAQAWMSDPTRHCEGVPVSVFFARPGDHHAVSEAKAICAGCPMLEPCRTYAIADPSLTGVWAGMTGRERRQARSGQPATPRRRPTVQHPDDRRKPGPAPTAPCGTNSAYIRHIRNREVPCDACRAAHNAYHVEQARQRRVAARTLRLVKS